MTMHRDDSESSLNRRGASPSAPSSTKLSGRVPPLMWRPESDGIHPIPPHRWDPSCHTSGCAPYTEADDHPKVAWGTTEVSLKLPALHQGSVLRAWVMDLPLREQGVLLAGIRGCDTVVDQFTLSQVPTGSFGTETVWRPVPHPTKIVVRMLRYSVCNPADPREVGTDGAFMADWREIKFNPRTWPVKCLDNLPTHFSTHLMHAVQVCAYRHPDVAESYMWHNLYRRIVSHMHLDPEGPYAMITRLSADRVASGEVKLAPTPDRV